jgi:hypothetical protein
MKRVQLIPMDRVSWELKFFVFFGENINWAFVSCFVGHKGSSLTWGFHRKEKVFKVFILLVWIIKHNQSFLKNSFRIEKHCVPIQIICLWLERAWLGT